MKVLKPSSIHMYLRSLEPTIIGNQLWPTSWVTSPKRSPFFRLLKQKMAPGYSIPNATPDTFTAEFHGYSKYLVEYISMLAFKYSVERPHELLPELSAG